MAINREPITIKSLGDLHLHIENAFQVVQTEDTNRAEIPGVAGLREKNRWWTVEGLNENHIAKNVAYFSSPNNPEQLNALTQFAKDLVQMAVNDDGLTILGQLLIVCDPTADDDQYLVVGVEWLTLIPQPIEEPIE